MPGSPSATTTIDGRYLPPPPAPFGGEIGLDAKDSKPYWPPTVVPPKGRAQRAPDHDRRRRLRRLRHLRRGHPDARARPHRGHGTALHPVPLHRPLLADPGGADHRPQPPRRRLRRHYRAVDRLPGYDSVIGLDNATVGEILKENGYATSWFGKEHNTPSFQYTLAGPFDQWPVGMGFDYFYGFMGGETDQWTPYLFRNTTQIFPWVGKPGWNLTTAMADDAIGYLKQINAAAPDKPFFLYYVPGGTHAPHQPTPEWIDKIHNMHLFDNGWNALREQIFANQKRLGVIPPSTQLTPWPDDLPKWDTLDADSKKLFARQAEVFAAYVAYTDHEIGRVIQEVEDEGKLDNTLIIYIEGDNGTSAEGSPSARPSTWPRSRPSTCRSRIS